MLKLWNVVFGALVLNSALVGATQACPWYYGSCDTEIHCVQMYDDSRVYVLIDETEALLYSIVDKMPDFAFKFPPLYESRMRDIGMVWRDIAAGWREYVLNLAYTTTVSPDDLLDLAIILQDVELCMDACPVHDAYVFDYDLVRLMQTLKQAMRVMKRPYLWGSSASLHDLIDALQDAQYAVADICMA